MIAFVLCSLFFVFLSESEKVFLDPLLILEAYTHREYNRVMIVELKEADINLYGNLSPLSFWSSKWKPDFIPIVYTKELKLDEVNCILKNIRNVKKCFAGNIVYVRSPRKLFPKNIIKENYHRNSGISVDEITREERIFTKIYESSEEIGARVARDVFRVSGKGVVVGIIDTGVRWYSKLLAYDISDALSQLGLKKNFSKSAIIWDQENQNYSGGFTTPHNFNYGIECLFPSLREGVKDHNGCPTQDGLGHGTHISGVISLDVGDGKEIGIAPESLLVVVSTPMYEDLVVDAVRYIFSYAEKWNLPAVINISLGGHFGPHDGTSLFELLIRQQLGKGRIIVSAAGNEANQKIHLGGEFEGEVSAVVDLVGDCEVQFWTSKDSNLEISAHILGIKDSYTEIKKGERKFVVSSGTQAALIDYEGGADISFYLENITYSKSQLKDGIIFASKKISDKLVLRFKSSKKIRIDGWISSDPEGCLFSSEGDLKPQSEGTISVPGTSPDIIAVGSYNLTSTRSKKKDISVFSSWGFDSSKPNITAPGEIIYSVCPSNDEYLCGDAGTSQATPHVTGAVALALERNPYLTPQDIIEALCKGALKDEFTGEVPNKIWGCGKLRVPEFLSNIPPVLPNEKKEKNVEIQKSSERIGNKTYTVLYLKSSFPFRVLDSSGYYDLGWSIYHKLYFDSNLPTEFEIEFLDKERKKVYTSGVGFDSGSCGCFVSSQENFYSALIFAIYIISAFILINMRRKKFIP
jgi:subtilisin family serine protease